MPNRRKPKNKKKYKKGKRGNDSESSTPHSSTPSVEDEKQQLLQGGACGSSDSRESRATVKTEGDARRSGSEKSPYRSTGETSRNASLSDNSSKMDLLAVPDQECGAYGPRSSSRSPLKLLKNVLTPKKKSPNRSVDSQCICKDEKHQPECPKLKNLAACAKEEGESMGVDESKPPSSDVSPIVSKKNKDCTQSSSSSDPSVTEYFKNSSEPEHSLARSPPTVPDQSGAYGESSPSKKSPLTLLKNVFKSKRSSPNRSPDTKRSFEDKTKLGLDSPENRKRETGARSKRPGRTKSEASSSGGSSVSRKDKDNNSSNKSSENSRQSSSKSFSHSDPTNAESSCSDKGKHSSEHHRNPTDYDPQGASKGPVRYESKRERHSGSDAEIEDIGQDAIPIIEQVDEEHDPNLPIPRPRSKSLSFFRLLRSVNPRRPSPRRYNLRSLGIQLSQIEWSWFEQMRRPMNPDVERTARENDPDENERGLLRRVEAVRPDPSTRRHVSLSPVRVRDCNCGAGNDGIDHHIGCSRLIDLRRRRNLRRCRQSPRRF